MTGADDLHITASNIVNNKTGVMFWGPAAHSVAFLGGTLCVSSPHQRTPAQLSGGSGSGDDCTGSYDFHFSQAYMVAHGFSVGTQVNVQYWSRDPMHADGTGVGLTDAVEFTICP